jgi:hypothetical protein
MKLKFVILLFILSLKGISQPPADFYVSGFAGTGSCDGTLRIGTCGLYSISTNGPNGPGISFSINNMCSGTYSVNLASSGGDLYFFQLNYNASGVTVTPKSTVALSITDTEQCCLLLQNQRKPGTEEPQAEYHVAKEYIFILSRLKTPRVKKKSTGAMSVCSGS